MTLERRLYRAMRLAAIVADQYGDAALPLFARLEREYETLVEKGDVRRRAREFLAQTKAA